MDIRQKYKPERMSEEGGAIGGSTLLSLSLFIILLAFFIVLTSMSTYSESKVEKAFDSLDLAFATKLTRSEYDKEMSDERIKFGKGNGDSLEDVTGVLRSILPGVDASLTENPNGGKVMAVRMSKDQFDRLTPQLIPLFVRILNIKDGPQDYDLTITSYVRDSLNPKAEFSYNVIQGYRNELINKGLSAERISLSIDLGNPAIMLFQFEKAINFYD